MSIVLTWVEEKIHADRPAILYLYAGKSCPQSPFFIGDLALNNAIAYVRHEKGHDWGAHVLVSHEEQAYTRTRSRIAARRSVERWIDRASIRLFNADVVEFIAAPAIEPRHVEDIRLTTRHNAILSARPVEEFHEESE